MPRQKKAEKTMPIAASSLIGDRVRIKVITSVLRIPAINAPTRYQPENKRDRQPWQHRMANRVSSKASRCTIK